MAALSSRVKGLKVRAPQGLTRRSRASPVSPCPGLLLGRHRRLPRFATAHASAPPRVTPTTQFMQRAQERETLAKATANAEAQAEAKKAAERWVALPKDAAVSDEDARGKEPSSGERKAAPRSEQTQTTNPRKDVTVTYAPRSSFVARGAPARVSFGGHNKATEAMNAERRERERSARAAVAARRSRPDDVSDAEMAAALAKKKKKKTSS